MQRDFVLFLLYHVTKCTQEHEAIPCLCIVFLLACSQAIEFLVWYDNENVGFFDYKLYGKYILFKLKSFIQYDH